MTLLQWTVQRAGRSSRSQLGDCQQRVGEWKVDRVERGEKDWIQRFVLRKHCQLR